MGNKFKVGLIRVLTSEDQAFVNLHGEVIMKHFPGIEVESKCIPNQWEGIHSHELAEEAIPKIIKVAHTFKDIDMLIVSCADDPGVAELRLEFPDLAVAGGGEATVALAQRYGDRIGVLGIVDYAPRAYREKIPDKICGVVRPKGVNSAVDLLTEAGRESCFEAAQTLKSSGAEVIALACTGLTTIGIAPEIERRVGIPVIDPVLAEGTIACFEKAKRSRVSIG